MCREIDEVGRGPKQPPFYDWSTRKVGSLAVEVCFEAVASCFQRVMRLIYLEDSSELLLKPVLF